MKYGVINTLYMYLYVIKWTKATSVMSGVINTLYMYLYVIKWTKATSVMSGVRNINGHSNRPWVSKANIPGPNDSIIPFTFIKIYVLRMR